MMEEILKTFFYYMLLSVISTLLIQIWQFIISHDCSFSKIYARTQSFSCYYPYNISDQN